MSPASGEENLPGWWQRIVDQDDAVILLTPAHERPPAPQPPPEPPKSGILNVRKPPGMTSHDVVQAIRKAAGERRVGHAGTLDPLARGVLVVCMGSATRVIEEIQAMTKRYEARVRLGEVTETYDAEGAVVERHDAAGVTRDAVAAALDAFRGTILQTPPMYSAVKHEGQRLYELARQGVEVARQPRPVSVHELTLTDWTPPELTLRMAVSSGTYVRSIAHDLGQALGVGAHLVDLERTAVGLFRVAEAEALYRVVEAFAEGWWPALLHPLDAALLDYAAVVVDDAAESALRNGQQVRGPPPGTDVTAQVRAYNHEGLFVGLLQWDPITACWQPRRMFPKAK